jgi:hypothetical protein
MKNVYKILIGKAWREETLRWEHNIKIGLRDIGLEGVV